MYSSSETYILGRRVKDMVKMCKPCKRPSASETSLRFSSVAESRSIFEEVFPTLALQVQAERIHSAV